MRKQLRKRKMLNSLTAVALSSSVLLGTIGQVPTVSHAVGLPKVEDVLAKLTPEQRAALEQLSTSEATGLQLSSSVDLNSLDEASVIVEFVNRPAKVARMLANEEGKSLTETAAQQAVDQDHTIFQQDVQKLLTDKNAKKVNYKINRSFKHAFNGVSMKLPANQIKNLFKSKAVKTVWSNEEFSIEPPTQSDGNKPLKADEFNVANYTPYDGLDKLHNEGLTGKGIKIGILDTGIDYNHPDLKDAYKGGYDFVDNDSDPMETTYVDWVKAGKPGTANGSDYYTEHGTHVAGIIGGRGVANSEYKTLGAAPEADLYGYRVLGPGGSGLSDDIIAAIDQSVKDGMDIINLSLGNVLNDPLYATSIAVNNAVLNGVTAIVAAGNAGSNMYTVGSPGTAALALTVGASSVAIDLLQYTGIQNNQSYTLRELAKNYADDLSSLKGKTLPLVNVGLGRQTDYNGKDVSGKIAFIQRGDFALIDKIKYAKENGAFGVIMANNEANKDEGPIQTLLGESTDAIPSFSVSYEEGTTMLAAIQSNHMDFKFGDFSTAQTAEDELAEFSSRGPTRLNYDIKPEVVAPGVSILSTIPFYVHNQSADGSNPEDYQYSYERLSGTSMATPYVAGVSALLLQSNKNLEPADIKSILMNTADPLSQPYSVFEMGSGRVDAYEAIHSNVELEVNDRTPMVMNGKEKSIKELTGALSFGSFGFDDKDISDSRTITLKNRSEQSKTFRVDVNFQTGLRDSKDAKANHVTLTGPTSVTVKGISHKSVNFMIHIPKTAEKGTYEGYVVFTNNADPSEQYQIPFGVRIVNEGIESFTALNPLFSTRLTKPSMQYAYPYLDASFSLKSYMKTLDVVLQDSVTGEDLGIVGSIPTYGLNEGIVYPLQKAFRGSYFPFTGDSKNPINMNPTMAKPGHYKLRLIGTSESGKTFATAADIVYDIAPPTVTSSFDQLDQKVIEYKESDLDENGQFLYDFNINVKDPEVEKAQNYGIPVDQSQNSVVNFYNSPYGSNPIPTDKNGDYTDKILVDSKYKYLNVSFYGRDAANNGTSPFTVVFAKETAPYYYVKASDGKSSIKTGESINYTVRANNIKNLKTTKFTIQAYNDHGIIENVKVAEAVKQYGDAEVSVTPAESGSSTYYTLTFTYNGTDPLPEDLSLFTFDIQATSQSSTLTVPIGSFNTTTIDQSGVETKNVYTYMERFDYQVLFSDLSGALNLEGTLDPVTHKKDYSIDQSEIGAKVSAESYDGKTNVEGSITSKTGGFKITGLPVDEHDYSVTVDVPGHFTTTGTIDVTDNIRGELYGKPTSISLPTAAAGDSNKDNVIDILDAVFVQTNWGSNKAEADFNFDGIVDVKDMDFVVKNFGLQNPSVSHAPKAKTKYKGKTLDNILGQLGMK